MLWHPRQACIWWTDIHACRLYRYDPADDKLTFWQTPERLTALGFTEDDDQLIVSFASGIAFYWPEQSRVQWLARPEVDITGNRFNDGRVSPAGHFWAGSLVEQDTGQQAALYRYNGDNCQRVLTGLQIVNGLCWSPDGRTGYYADSPTRKITAYDHLPLTGELSNPRPFVQTPEGSFPDGACVDARGNVWSAHWGGGCVVCYSPAGEIIETLTLPVSQPTCVAFGGPDLNWLLVTSARENLTPKAIDAEPMAGDLFIFDTTAVGLPPAIFPSGLVS
ncbi:MAG TPA: SMP-30/gluconolactonase/LRE family protein [Cellvibrionaceae bacterium]